jgi:hypothetical protein
MNNSPLPLGQGLHDQRLWEFLKLSGLGGGLGSLRFQGAVEALDGFVDFGRTFEADDHGIDAPTVHGILDGFLPILRVSEIAIANQLHRDDSTATLVHRVDFLHGLGNVPVRRHDLGTVAIHVAALWIDSRELHFDPRIRCRGSKRGKAVARHSFGADPAFYLRFIKSIHHGL